MRAIACLYFSLLVVCGWRGFMRIGAIRLALSMGLALVTAAQAQTPAHWSAVAEMNTLRYSHAATLLTNGELLVAGGRSAEGSTATAEIYNPGRNQWRPAASMSSSRYLHTATILRNGKVLVVGGLGSSTATRTSQLYDPVTDTWGPEVLLADPRAAHTATLLDDGRVLVAGGRSPVGHYLKTAELYDPASGTWTAVAAQMADDRHVHTATLLADGKVLIAGGLGSAGFLDQAELFDPLTQTFSVRAQMLYPRQYQTATLLADGRVLVAGGFIDGGETASTAELYDPVMDTWTATGSMERGRAFHSATLLPGGKVLVYGGQEGLSTRLSDAETYDPSTGRWMPEPLASEARVEHTATLMPDGKVLVVGGFKNPSTLGIAKVESYQPATSSGGSVPMSMGVFARENHTSTLLADGRVLVVGGSSSGQAAASVAFDSASSTWSQSGLLNTPRGMHTATLLADGRLLVTGGVGASGPLDGSEVFDSQTGQWTVAPALEGKRYSHTATLLKDGKVLVTGGSDGDPMRPLARTEVFNPAANAWKTVQPLVQRRMGHRSVLLADGRVLVMGGLADTLPIASTEIYDPHTEGWTAMNPMLTARGAFAMALLPSGKVMVAGGGSNSSYLQSVEVFDPATNNWTAMAGMLNGRREFQLVPLPDGKVLALGGAVAGGHTAQAELYDPLADSWASVSSMSSPRGQFAASLLPDGGVLVTGGRHGAASLESAEVFRPQAPPPAAPQLQAPVVRLLRPETPLQLSGNGLFGSQDATGGSYSQSSSNQPALQLRRLDNDAITWQWLTAFSTDSLTTAAWPVEPLATGWYAATVFVNGVASNSVILRAPQPPGTPSITEPPAPQHGAVQVNWNPPADDGGASLTNYLVQAYVQAAPTVPVGAPCSVAAAQILSGCTIHGLLGGTSYVFSVRAVNRVGESLPAMSGPATPFDAAGAPLGVTTEPGDGQIIVRWSPPARNNGSPVIGYTVFAYEVGSTTVAGQCSTPTVVPPATPMTECTVPDLVNGQDYLLRVVAINGAGSGAEGGDPAPATPVASVNIPVSVLPAGTVGVGYGTSISPQGGAAPYQFRLVAGELPEGLSLVPGDGGRSIAVSGTPARVQTATFTLEVSDSTVVDRRSALSKAGPTIRTVSKTFTLTIGAAVEPEPPVATPVPALGLGGLMLLTALLAGMGLAGRQRIECIRRVQRKKP